MTEPRALIEFVDRGRKATQPANPDYPDGVDIDVSDGAARACLIALPYPAKRCGLWLVACELCGCKAAVTCAGRADDPRSLKMRCKLI